MCTLLHRSFLLICMFPCLFYILWDCLSRLSNTLLLVFLEWFRNTWMFPLCQPLLFVLRLAPLLLVSVRPLFPWPCLCWVCAILLSFPCILWPPFSSSVLLTKPHWYVFGNNDTSVPQVASSFLKWESVEVITQLNCCNVWDCIGLVCTVKLLYLN